MEIKRVNCFLENKTILVTGSTGFLAKVLVEKILNVQPNVKKIYLLLRASDSDSARQRMNSEIVEKDLFRVLRTKWDKAGFETLIQKLVPIPGDIAHENFGIKDFALVEQMFKDIEVIVNSAATTNFDDRYDVSLSINTMGALNILNFANNCTELNIIIHVSTAYVCGEQEGLVPEKVVNMGDTLKETACKLDINFENKLVREKLKRLRSEGYSEKDITIQLKNFGMERAKLFGWPNTYSFTKAMGEMNLREFNDQNIPIVIIRPTIIASTYKHPFPGWIEGIKTMDAVIAGYCKGKLPSFYATPSLILDIIPADMVVNSIMVAMVTHANKPTNNDTMIYQMGSSHRNPISFSTMQQFCFEYFTENPMADKEGRPILVEKQSTWNSLFSFRIYMMIRFGMLLKIFQWANTALFGLFQDKYNHRQRKFNLGLRLVEIYKPYLMFQGVFDDKNSEELQKKAMASFVDANLFNFDSKCINWEDFIMNSHIPGLMKYAVK